MNYTGWIILAGSILLCCCFTYLCRFSIGKWTLRLIYKQYLWRTPKIDQSSRELLALIRFFGVFLKSPTKPRVPSPAEIKTIRKIVPGLFKLIYDRRKDMKKDQFEITNALDDSLIRCCWILDKFDVVTKKERCILWFHAGSFVIGEPSMEQHLVEELCNRSDTPALMVSYRLCPESTIENALSDALASYQYLIEECQIPPSSIIVGGLSAGAFLSLLLLHELKVRKLPLPAGAIPSSVAAYDLVLETETDNWPSASVNLQDPTINFASWSSMNELLWKDERNVQICKEMGKEDWLGFPPILLHSGGIDPLKYGSQYYAEKAQKAGVKVTFKEWANQLHGCLGHFQYAPESMEVMEETISWVRITLGLDNYNKVRDDIV